MLLTRKGDYDTMKPWNESEHPRDPNGKFTDKGGDGGYRERVNAQIKWAKDNGVDLPLYSDGTLDTKKLSELQESFNSGKSYRIGAVDFNDKGAVHKLLDEYEAKLYSLTYEVQITILPDGSVWRSNGHQGRVDNSDIHGDQRGSYLYHNHPETVTNFSFSAEDIRDFYEKGEAYSRASDYLYDYEMWRTVETVELSKEEAFHEFKNIYKNEVYQMSIDKFIDIDVDGFHKTMELLASRLGFKYRRRNRNGK